MKKLKFTSMILLTVLCATLLAGCEDRDDDRTDALEEKIDRLEQEVTDLENQNKSQSSDGSTDNSGSSETSSAGSSDDDTLEALTTAVNDAVESAKGAEASGTDEEKKKKFFALKEVLDQVGRRLDAYDDSIEAQYKQGNLSREDYRKQEKDLEGLEDKLDAAEEELEWTFGIDD